MTSSFAIKYKKRYFFSARGLTGLEFVVNFHKIPKVVNFTFLSQLDFPWQHGLQQPSYIHLTLKTVPVSKIPLRCNIDKNPYVRYVLVPSEQRHCNR